VSNDPVDIAIVGAGVAGLAAAERAAEIGLTAIVLEASDRIGGRVLGLELPDGSSVDLGPHWLHQVPINPFVPEAEASGAITSKSWQPVAGIWMNGSWLDEMDIATIQEQIDDLETLARELDQTGEDTAVADLIDPLFTLQTPLRLVLEHRLGIAPTLQSAVDLSRWDRHDGSWPVGAGLASLINQRYANVGVMLNTEVRVIDWGTDPVRLDAGDDLYEAHHVIVTISIAALQSGAMHFAPDLPDSTSRAILDFAVTAEARIVIDFGAQLDEWPPESLLLTTAVGRSVAFETPVLGQTIGTAVIRGVDAEESQAVLQRAADVFGVDRGSLSIVAAAEWHGAPNTAGGVAVLRPGAARARLDLATSIDNRLFFAGEATSVASFGTVHGARNEGIRAVNAIAEKLGLLPTDGESRDTISVFRFDF
jgi:monoamine oxidase